MVKRERGGPASADGPSLLMPNLKHSPPGLNQGDGLATNLTMKEEEMLQRYPAASASVPPPGTTMPLS